ncbi:hypothetical protein AJ80_05509 [Polytolypa hystricis UAMH7299]|uniref:Cytochrome P450 n=1 Tax=Polytolypa hystricis (strain UAMH7299) TaxID=1447883 RepID=A0A2B7Y3S0_POLH7|nr:hypothetical protein AJ80_05509 [Polytolypa hystricis UAMH7299]
MSKVVQFPYTMPGPELSMAVFKLGFLRRFFANVMVPATPDIAAEVVTAMQERWEKPRPDGCDRGWREVKVLDTVQGIVARSMSIVYIGKELARESGYVDAMIRAITAIPACGTAMSIFPEVLRGIAANVVCFPSRYYRWRLGNKYLCQEIVKRKAIVEGRLSPVEETDFLLNFIAATQKAKNPIYYETDVILTTFIIHNIAAVHTMSGTFTAVVENLLRYPGHIPLLRTEAERIISHPHDPITWTKSEINELKLHEAFIRETMRLWPLMHSTMTRTAMHEEGYRFRDGSFVPAGFSLGVAAQAVHTDEQHYEHPMQFDPKRFTGEQVKMKKDFLASTSQTFLTWGDGHHACPGRFFASHVLKILLASLVLNYEIEAASHAPRAERSLGILKIPNHMLIVRVRRIIPGPGS